MFKAINIKKLLSCVVLTELVGVISCLIGGDGSAQYGGFLKPALAMPAGAFPWFWGIFLLLAGVALYIVYESAGRRKSARPAVTLFYIQLAFTFMLPILFYGLQLRGFAVIWTVALLILLAVNIRQFYVISKPAGILLIPYFLWAVYLLYLYYGIWSMNVL